MTLRARLVGRASLAGLAPLLLALLGACSSDSAASSPNGPTAMEVLGLDPAGARVCLGDGRPPAELRVKNTGRRTFGYTVEAPMPLLGATSGGLTAGSTSGPIVLGLPYVSPKSSPPAAVPPLVVSTTTGLRAEYPVRVSVDPSSLRVRQGPNPSLDGAAAFLVIGNPTVYDFEGTVTAPAGLVLADGEKVSVPAGGATELTLTLAPGAAAGAVVTGDVVVSSAACGPERAARAPVTARIPSRAVGVAAGDAHSCVVDATGAVWCWGDGRQGQLGVDSAGSAKPVRVPTLTADVSDVRAGLAHTCALRNKKLVCWGADEHGQLGHVALPKNEPAEAPVDDVVAFSAGGFSTCAVRGDGHLLCWGRDVRPSANPAAVHRDPAEPFAITDAVDVAIGAQHACVLRRDASLACWGAGGLLGDGTTNGPDTTVPVPGLGRVTEIAVGRAHACAIIPNGMACWGENGAFGLVDGTPSTVVLSPKQRGTQRLLCAANDATCFLETLQSDPKCTGPIPFSSVSLPTARSACGGRHACFVGNGKQGPSVQCIGDNDRGQSPPTVEGF